MAQSTTSDGSLSYPAAVTLLLKAANSVTQVDTCAKTSSHKQRSPRFAHPAKQACPALSPLPHYVRLDLSVTNELTITAFFGCQDGLMRCPFYIGSSLAS